MKVKLQIETRAVICCFLFAQSETFFLAICVYLQHFGPWISCWQKFAAS